MSEALFKVSGLHMVHGQRTLLSIKEFELKPGTHHIVVGPNGGGKSLFFKALLGQARHQGQIHRRPDLRGRMGLVPQSTALDSFLPLETMEFLLLAHQKKPLWLGKSPGRRAKAEALLTSFNLAHLQGRTMATLSGGERQALLLIQALMGDPLLLMLDEADASADEAVRPLMRKRIQEFVTQGGTVLEIHHDLDLVRKNALFLTALFNGVSGQFEAPFEFEDLDDLHRKCRGVDP